jgi:hypothetical protein
MAGDLNPVANRIDFPNDPQRGAAPTEDEFFRRQHEGCRQCDK